MGRESCPPTAPLPMGNRHSVRPTLAFANRPRWLMIHPAMKSIWSILFVAIAAAIFGIALLLVDAASRTDKFWLSMGGLAMGVLTTFIAFALRPGPQGEQGGTLFRGTLAFASFFYFFGTIVLACVAATSIPFKWLAVFHILALLFWVVLACFGGLGAGAMANADRSGK